MSRLLQKRLGLDLHYCVEIVDLEKQDFSTYTEKDALMIEMMTLSLLTGKTMIRA